MDSRPGRLILVVEDEADLASTCERLLRRRGHAVVTAASREAGLAALAATGPAVVVSDVRLPDGDGLDVVRAATAMQPQVPAVVMTARPSEPGRRAARAAGAVAYLPKPFTATAFAGLVDRVLVGHRMTPMIRLAIGGSLVGVLLSSVVVGPASSQDATLVAQTAVAPAADGPSYRSQEGTAMKVREIMTTPPISVGLDVPVLEARQLMAAHRIRHLPVTDAGRLMGIVTAATSV